MSASEDDITYTGGRKRRITGNEGTNSDDNDMYEDVFDDDD